MTPSRTYGKASSRCSRCWAPRTRSRWCGSPSWTTGSPRASTSAILAGNYPRREDDGDASVQDEFVAAAKSYQESWSRSSDPFIGLVKGVAETAVGTGQSLFGNIFGQRGGGERQRRRRQLTRAEHRRRVARRSPG